MNKFVHKTIAAIMIAGASIGIASTTMITSAHAATLADSTDLTYGETLSGDVYKDVKYGIKGEVPEGTTFSKTEIAENLFELDEKTGEITILAGAPNPGVTSGPFVSVKYSDGSSENIEISIDGEPAESITANPVKVIAGAVQNITAKSGDTVALDFPNDERVSYRVKFGTLPDNIKNDFKISHLGGTIQFTAPKDFDKPIKLEVEAFKGVGEKNIEVVETYTIVITPENGSSQTPNNPGNSDKNGREENNSVDDNKSEISDDRTDGKDTLDKKDDETNDKSVDNEKEETTDDKSQEESQSPSPKTTPSVNENVKPNIPLQPNPSRVNTPPVVPVAPVQNVSPASQVGYGPKVLTGGNVDNIWTQIADVIK